MEKILKKSIFKNFTNLYSLSKTLRFELRPTKETQSLINVISQDKEIDRLYHEEMKPIFDNLHKKFITEALDSVYLSKEILQKMEIKYQTLQVLNKDRKNNREKIEKIKEEIATIQNQLRNLIVKYFYSTGEKWKKEFLVKGIELKNTGYNILFENKILDILKIINPEKKKYISEFDKFFTYFSGFNLNRANYYSNEVKETAISYRIVNENLIRFLHNRQLFVDILAKMSELKEFEWAMAVESFQGYLTQEAIENFNEEIIGAINLKINLFHQKNKGIFKRVPVFKALYKQIGCGEKAFDLFSINSGDEWKQLEELYNIKENERSFSQNELLIKIEQMYENFFANLDSYELDKIYFNKSSINTISSSWLVNWHKLAELLGNKKIIKNKNKETGEYTIPKKIALIDLKEILGLETNLEDLFKKGKIDEEEAKKKNPKGAYEKLFSSNAWKTFLLIWKYEIDKNFSNLKSKIKEFKIRKQTKFEKSDKIKRVIFVKEFCDAFLSIERMVKYHRVNEDDGKDDSFYETIDLYLHETKLNKYYNAFRNYLTKKPFSENKIKLNFENGTLLGGWSDGQEKIKGAVLLKNNNKFYLGILKDRGFFRTDKKNKMYVEKSNWGRLILTNLKFQTLAGKGFLGKYKKSYGEIGKNNPMKAVSLLQEFIKKNYVFKYPELKEVSGKSYSNKKDFDKEIKEALERSFNMYFNPINPDLLVDGVRNEKLYLFEIVNKDLVGKEREGNKNIHSLYWLGMFSEKNLQYSNLALNGHGEIFFRKGQRDKLVNKVVNGKEVLDAKRYADDKIFLHVPITINYGKQKNIKFKDLINNTIKDDTDNITILGIDRGEKHLLYYSLINNKGKVIKQGSLNKIKVKNTVDEKEIITEYSNNGKLEKVELRNTGKRVDRVDYHLLLDYYEKKRILARQSWEAIGKIKDLKAGYLSQVVHEIYELVIEYNAIIVLEDLNSEFKAKRTAKVEKSVYKKFELALARKLNHLILKDKKAEELGSAMNAYQLTPAIGAGDVGKFEKAKQWGIMFYVRPDYTSQTDPVTGWRKTIYISNSETISNIKKKWQESNIRIDFDTMRNCFKFSYGNWNLFAHDRLERLYWSRNEKNSEGSFGNMKKYNLHDKFEELFKDNNIDKTKDINAQVLEKEDFDWKTLIFYWNLLTQIRNSDKLKEGNSSDFIQSPVWSNKINDFYDNRKKYHIVLPENGDANGAYNIARKGIMIVSRIKENPLNPNLFITNTEWDNFAQK